MHAELKACPGGLRDFTKESQDCHYCLNPWGLACDYSRGLSMWYLGTYMPHHWQGGVHMECNMAT